MKMFWFMVSGIFRLPASKFTIRIFNLAPIAHMFFFPGLLILGNYVLVSKAEKIFAVSAFEVIATNHLVTALAFDN